MLHIQTVERATFKLLENIMGDMSLQSFALAGGTALALYLGHRKSIDIDMFTGQDFDVPILRDHLVKEYGFKEDVIDKQTLKGFIDDIKVEFLGYRYPNVFQVIETGGMRLYSTGDIAAMKLSAISYNGTRLKDFVDIAFLSAEMSLQEMLSYFAEKYPNSSTISAVKGLLYHDDIDFSVSVTLIKGTFNWEKIRERLHNMVADTQKVFTEYPL